MKTLIIGMGEVGQALYKVLGQYNPWYKDKSDTIKNWFGEALDDYALPSVRGMLPNQKLPDEFEIIHICFPYSPNFVQYVKEYQEKYKPKYTIIHSTVPVGTSRQCGALHSPIRGIHPYLAEGIRTFVKFIGGEQASEVADYFRRAGVRVMLFDKQENAEALKLFDTEYYRVCIEFAQRVKQYCLKYGLSFSDVYRMGNITYNEGYAKLGHPEFVRPVLEPIMKEIGGHCVLPNKELIKLSEDD